MRYDSIFMEGYNVPPVLSKEESYILIDKAQSGDKSARDKIIEHNLRLVMMVVKSFKNTPYEFNDLLSYGIIGLINAVDNYDKSKDIEFTTYFVKCIKNSILYYLKIESKKIKTISLDECVSSENKEKDGDDTSLKEFISDKRVNIADSYETKETNAILHHLVSELPAKESEYLTLYFGLDNNEPKCLQEIADIYNLSKQCIYIVVHRALTRLRNRLLVEYNEEGHPLSISRTIKF